MSVDDEQGNHVTLCGMEGFKKYLADNAIDEVIFAVSNEYVTYAEEYILICEEKGVTASVLLDLFPNQHTRISISDVGPLPMITFHTVTLNKVQMFIKRSMDIIGEVLGIIFTYIIWIVTAIAIKIDSEGPAFLNKTELVGMEEYSKRTSLD